MIIHFYGHAAFLVAGSRRILIDPFLSANPLCPLTEETLPPADAIVVTHDHPDHLGDAFAICREHGATVYSLHEIAVMAGQLGIKAEGMNIGGKIAADGFTIHLVPAFHTSPSGGVCGAVIEMDGRTVYHAGDTGLFGDMRLIGELFRPDVMLVPIGDRYTMGPEMAARAVELVRPKRVVPMHYNTWPVIASNPEIFRSLAGAYAPVSILDPGGDLVC
jgi:L-ascorbate metabolism protein UlaG (beta-lactamase superfamily)